MDIKELSSILQQNGIVGAGGAGFPTYAKLNEKAETLILNCAECEPLFRLHRQLLEKYASEITDTFALLGKVVGAKELVIGIKRSYKKTITALLEVIGEYPDMRLSLLDEVYPAGDEVVLIYETTRKVVAPGGLPIDEGIAVFNVETVFNIFRALHRQTPVIDKLVSVVAEVEHPVTVRVPIGITIEETVRLAGANTVPEAVYMVGGAMMGRISSGNAVVTKTTNAILVLPKDHLLVRKKQRKTSIDLKRAAAACCQCSMCTDLCPRNKLGHPIEPHLFMRAATCKDIQEPNIFLNTLYCSSCGLCEMYSCPQGLAPRSLIADYKAGLRANGMKPERIKAKEVDPEREYRKAPMKRMIARLDLYRYNKEAPLDESKVTASKVKILLNQHIGAMSVPIVKEMDIVKEGQMIAKAGNGLGVAIHASISGQITKVENNYVIIEQRKDV